MPRIVDHEQHRADLLHGCFELFAREGYGAVTMRRIARELNCSTGQLYHYFESKDDLFAQMSLQIQRQVVADAAVAVGPFTGTDERLQALLRFVHRDIERIRNMTLIRMEYQRRGDQSVVEQRNLAYRQAIARLVDLDNPPVVDWIMTVILGVVMHTQVNPELDVETEFGILESYVRGL